MKESRKPVGLKRRTNGSENTTAPLLSRRDFIKLGGLATLATLTSKNPLTQPTVFITPIGATLAMPRYFHGSLSGVDSYYDLTTASPSESLKEISLNVATTGDKSVGKWVTESLSAQTFDAQTWHFYLWCKQSSPPTNVSVFCKVYHRHDSTEDLKCTSTEASITETSYTEKEVTAAFPDTTVGAGDRIVVEVLFRVT